MFEKIADFDKKKFTDLWNGFSCECIADNYGLVVIFSHNGKEEITIEEDEASDLLDFVLSFYYENNDTKIEDGFSAWLMEHYGNSEEVDETLTVNDIPLPILYKTLLQDWKRQDKIIKKQKNEIKKYKKKIEDYSLKNFELRKQIERYEGGEIKGETLHDIIVHLNEAVRKRNKIIEELQKKLLEK